MTTTWNPTGANAAVVFSTDRLTISAPSSGGTWSNALSTSSHLTGLYYLEHTIVANSALNGSNGGVSIGQAGFVIAAGTPLGAAGSNSAGYFPWSGLTLINGAAGSIQAGTTPGIVVQQVVDMTGGAEWWKTGASFWNNSGTANPLTGTGGIVTETGATSPFIAGSLLAPGQITTNFGGTPFAFPVFFAAFQGVGGAAWDPTGAEEFRSLLLGL
jgi:hypothetical protein